MAEESIEATANPLTQPTIEDPARKHFNKYAHKRCGGKKCRQYIAPRYLKVKKPKGWKPKPPPSYIKPVFRAPPKKDGLVTIHLKNRREHRFRKFGSGSTAHLTNKHVVSPNEEWLKSQKETIEPQYVRNRRSLKHFFGGPKPSAQARRRRHRRGSKWMAPGSVVSANMERMFGKSMIVPSYAKFRGPKQRHNHVGVWPPARVVKSKKQFAVALIEEDAEPKQDKKAKKAELKKAHREAKRDAKALKKLMRSTSEAHYLGERRHRKPRTYVAPEYGSQKPLHRRHRKSADGLKKRKHPRVFRSHYFSPLPKGALLAPPTPREARRMEHKKAEERKRKFMPFLRPVQTPSGRMLKLNGFVEPSYDNKLAKWKPRKAKRTMVPAPVVFSELHIELGRSEVDPKDVLPEHRPTLPSTKLTSKPVMVKRTELRVYDHRFKLPVFSNSKVETRDRQARRAHKFQSAEIKPHSFFRPRLSKRDIERRRRRERDEKEGSVFFPRFAAEEAQAQAPVAAVAADALDMSAAPTTADMPALALESTEVVA